LREIFEFIDSAFVDLPEYSMAKTRMTWQFA